ncbi:GTPase [Candidatus Woesearchaeota archaeon]|nr:GTPase [Candidatus Woesearchaeota archaeon]
MTTNFWKVVNNVIRDADIILEVLDARMISETRNIELEDKIRSENKKILYVITKSDLVDKKSVERAKKELNPAVFISAKEHHGTTILRHTILKMTSERPVRVGVVGYPNTGKSSLINALKGSGAAPVSSKAGFTKGKQFVRTSNILLIDTPGVIPYKEGDQEKLALIGSVNPEKIKDPDIIAAKILAMFDDVYGVKVDDEYLALEEIAIKKGKLKKGGEPDVDALSRMIIRDWQQGKL